LQTRNGKRTGFAGVRIASEMLEEGLIGEKDVLTRIEPNALTQLLRPIFDQESKRKALKEKRLLAKGLNAGPGAATGAICFFAEEVEEARRKYGNVILVRTETSGEDIKGMENADGILTARGGMTSHAALVARQRGKVCVAGCDALDIDYGSRTMKAGEKTLKEGGIISIDGSTGEVFEGGISMNPSEIINVLVNRTMKPDDSTIFQQFSKVMAIADKYRRLGVRTNADRPSEAEQAVAFGAEGIGLCRTEHMFFEGDRIKFMRKMILADTGKERRAALDELLPFQQNDFEGIFRAMAGMPVTIRTLDPPLHEFLPQKEKEIKELAGELGVTAEKVKERINQLHEANPMLGHRGCRLGITSPEITEMQARAIFRAAVKVKKDGVDVKPEIMIPLVGHVNELRHQEKIVRAVAEEVFREK
ncbi:MAG: pyruvate, phosphate dikinase, partial [Deltaproteobacteria bacterium]|nr:pyruvate, phosphate dikinase [Deltaproteobacteria bacterium]